MNTRFDDDDLLHVVETYPPDHPAHMAALRQMFEALPQEQRDRLNREAMDVLGNPEPDGYDKDGKRIWRADTIAQHAGVPVEAIERAAKQYDAMFGTVVPDDKVAVLTCCGNRNRSRRTTGFSTKPKAPK